MIRMPISKGPLNYKEKINQCAIFYLDNDKERMRTVMGELSSRFYDGTKMESVYQFEFQNPDFFNLEELLETEKKYSRQKERGYEKSARFVFTTADLPNLKGELVPNAGVDFAIRCLEKTNEFRFHPQLRVVFLDSKKPKDLEENFFNKVIINDPKGYVAKQTIERRNHENYQNLYHPWTDKIIDYIISNRLKE